MQRQGTETIQIAWPSLPRTTAGRILQRQRATLRRLHDRNVRVAVDALEPVLERLIAQWVDAAAAGRDVVSLELVLSADEIHDWLSSAYELLSVMTDEQVMSSLQGPALSPGDAGVLRGMIDHVARVSAAG